MMHFISSPHSHLPFEKKFQTLYLRVIVDSFSISCLQIFWKSCQTIDDDDEFFFGMVDHCNAFPASIYLLKFNIKNTKTRCEICSMLTIKTPERCHWRRSCVFIVNFEYILHLILVFLLLTLNMYILFPAGIIVGGSHHHKPPTRREKDPDLGRTWFQAFLNEVVL